ncbi:hypothetical protein GBA52_028800 [Prunus armeniaca]|nr:hypothetical protein GBA52_028800 [Prunus armeniaca]
MVDLEGVVRSHPIKKDSWKTLLTLAYQSLGVVYGDLSTSPLYVYKSTFAEDIHHSETNEEIYGVLSFVFWTLTLIPLVKYVWDFCSVFTVIPHARVSSLPNCQLADEELSEYTKDGVVSTSNSAFGSSLKSTLEKHRVLQKVLLILALIGTCMVIGDGVLTPAISGTWLCNWDFNNENCFMWLQFFRLFRVWSFPCQKSSIDVSSFLLELSFHAFKSVTLFNKYINYNRFWLCGGCSLAFCHLDGT